MKDNVSTRGKDEKWKKNAGFNEGRFQDRNSVGAAGFGGTAKRKMEERKGGNNNQ
jgi:hypothetical protein